MPAHDLSEFKIFISQHKSKLTSIAYRTFGEYELADVINEAWLTARAIEQTEGIVADFLNLEFQSKLLGHVYNKLIKFTEKNIRYAIKLDHAPEGLDSDEGHPLQYKLAIDEDYSPLTQLINNESESSQEQEIPDKHSLAGAYLTLLRHFDNRMIAVADHLLISVSHAYRCCANVRRMTETQRHLTWYAQDNSELPRPWRRSRANTNAACEGSRRLIGDEKTQSLFEAFKRNV